MTNLSGQILFLLLVVLGADRVLGSLGVDTGSGAVGAALVIFVKITRVVRSTRWVSSEVLLQSEVAACVRIKLVKFYGNTR